MFVVFGDGRYIAIAVAIDIGYESSSGIEIEHGMLGLRHLSGSYSEIVDWADTWD